MRGDGTRSLLLAVLPVLVGACAGYHPPSPRGYHYDRGQAMARSDTGVGRLIYYSDADDLTALSQRIEANCGFTLRPTPADGEPARRDIEFVQGYNSVSVPAIEERLGAKVFMTPLSAWCRACRTGLPARRRSGLQERTVVSRWTIEEQSQYRQLGRAQDVRPAIRWFRQVNSPGWRC